jgi:hypothetical protein
MTPMVAIVPILSIALPDFSKKQNKLCQQMVNETDHTIQPVNSQIGYFS